MSDHPSSQSLSGAAGPRALLLVAHGSRREASNAEVRALALRLRQQAGTRYDFVRCAFLELAEPSIPDGVEQCIAAGAREVVVLPYFLSAGRHVAEDIPAALAAPQARHPEVRIHIAAYAGSAPGMPQLLLELSP